jgi:hypothetical protein
MKDESDATVISTMNEVFPDSVITGCNTHLSQCLGRQLHNISLTVEYKEHEDVRHTCNMRAASTYLPVNQVEEDLLVIMQLLTKNLFLDYNVQKLIENKIVPIEMWNIYKNRHRTNNAVEGWNRKLKSVMGKQQPNGFSAGTEK